MSVENKEYYYNLKRKEFDDLKRSYTNNGTVSWATFKADTATHRKKVVELTQDDFANGTLRVQEPCMLKLTENIQFNPNRPTTWLDSGDNVTSDFAEAVKIDPDRTLDWFPKSSATDNSQYFESDVAFAYGLGFFAAITIECADVILYLNNYTLEQHAEHALQQRFFACVELADQPFIPFQGPSNFGTVLRSAKNTLICNGKIGHSSHHGIHGNDGDNLMIEDVSFSDFEVSPLALNGFHSVFLKNITVEKNLQTIPVLGTYSAGRFLKQFYTLTVTKGHNTSALDTAIANLNTSLDETFNGVIFSNGTIDPTFHNTTGLIDGNAYGILINPKGVAVNSFLDTRSTHKANEVTNVYMVNCHVNNIKGKINEILAISNTAGNAAQIDTAGASLQFFNGVSSLSGDKYYYDGTVLSDVQIELAKIKYNLDISSPPVSSKYLGTLNIEKGVVDWKDNSALYFKAENGYLKLYDGSDNPYLLNSQQVSYKIFGNSDTMFHVNKGIIGYKIDGVNNLCMINCSVSNITNEGLPGSNLPGYYLQSHPLTSKTMVGYQGAKTYGMVLSAVNDVVGKNFLVTDIESKYASAYGVAVINESTNSHFTNTKIKGVRSKVDDVFDQTDAILPNDIPISRAVYVDRHSFNITFKNTHTSTILNSEGNPFIYEYDIRSQVHFD